VRYVPALDGLRGVAVLGVLLFHAGLPLFSGGFLGVSTFFTLSGFLITSLLLRDHDQDGRLHLQRFWLRRARRLMPASLLALTGIAVYAAVAVSPDRLTNLRGDLLAALLNVANWHFLLSGQTYGDLAAGPSLTQHFWSLSIEEQFYLVFPLIALLALRYGGRRLFVWVLGVLAVLSVASSALLAGAPAVAEAGGTGGPGAGYYATNSRAVELLLGALLALWLTGPGRVRRGRHQRPAAPRDVRGWSIAGSLALLLLIAAWALVGLTDPWLLRGGLAVHAALVVVVLTAIMREAEGGGPLSRLLASPPLRRLGQVSYGVYLFHWPLFLALDEGRTGLSGWRLFLLRVVATLLVAVASYTLVEQPIRRGATFTRRPALLALPAGTIALVAAVAVVNIHPIQVAHANARLQDFVPQVQTAPGGAQDPNSAPGSGATNAGARPAVGRSNPSADTVLVIGDSVLYDTEPALTASLTSAGYRTVINAAYPGIALTTSYDWRTHWQEFLDRYHPDVVIILIGRWDRDFIRSKGLDAYAPLVDEAARLLTSRGARVLWLDPLLSSWVVGENEQTVFHQLPGLLPGRVENVDVNPALRGPDGSWLTTTTEPDGTVDPVRKPDRDHPCQAGAELMTDAIMARLVGLGWSPPAADGWQSGEWRQSPRFSEPPHGCEPVPPGRTVPS
jgi:peptidoglycan/LPS O-acetylase OafA/YrhL